MSDNEAIDRLDAALSSIQKRESVKPQVREISLAKPEQGEIPHHALLLVGSPRMKTSSSLALGTYLLEELETKGITVETHFTHQAYRLPEKKQALMEGIDRSDLVVFAFPLYVDSIASPAIQVLEEIALYRQKKSSSAKQTRFVAIANSGFPEAEQNRTALAICESFAAAAGFQPAGTLAIGGGEGLVRRKPIRNAHGPVERIKNGLQKTADALVRGEGVPEEVRQDLAKPFIPKWLYRLAGGIGWKIMARKYKKQNELRATPYGD
jgi:hypothetical protein